MLITTPLNLVFNLWFKQYIYIYRAGQVNNKVKVNRLTLLRNSVKCNGLRVLRRCDTVENSCYETCQVIIFLAALCALIFFSFVYFSAKVRIFLALHNFLTASSPSWPRLPIRCLVQQLENFT